ncbi:M15 family metallopeptidase [Aquicoccus sp. G2-2]|uniref:M15 family metallopeptidase n=1 Tax=Aquicoccus sp. G2-2 TaxID=3092120 RepID=UPI002AE05F3D|nr:M15 family metallopeptidase [Aquicoccus sp. G2-2]MEA1114675.1 M15 family metallopeptidase [Aquicoccus sp. G2-2]
MREGALIGPIIIAIGLIVAAISFALVGALLETADGSAELRMERSEAAVSRLQADQDELRADLQDAKAEIERLSEDMAMRAATPAGVSAADPDIAIASPEITGEDETTAEQGVEAPTEKMLLAKARFNKGITQPGNRVMLDVLGHPRSSYSTNCQPVTNPRLKSLLETRQVGPIRVTMVKPALESLERIYARLLKEEPDIAQHLGTAGALCARLIRGSTRSVSNHSWGTAIDVKIEGQLDPFADGSTQFGLLLLAEFFNDEGWFWGAAYRREDSMHFEVGVETLRKWQAEGKL